MDEQEVDEWCWLWISMNVPISDVWRYPLLPWSKMGLSCNKGIQVEDILYLNPSNATDEWDWDNISSHIYISEVRKYPHLPWSKRDLSENKGITIEVIDILDGKSKIYRIPRTSFSDIRVECK